MTQGPEGERAETPPIERLKAVLGLSGLRSNAPIEKHTPLIKGQYLIATYHSPDSGSGEGLIVKAFETEQQGIELSFTKDGLVGVTFLMMEFSVGEERVGIQRLSLSLRDIYDEQRGNYQKLTYPIADWIERVIKEGRIDEFPFEIAPRKWVAPETPQTQE